MKCIDVTPHENVKNPDHYNDVPIYRYTPTLARELEKGIITADQALLLFRAMEMQREFERMVAEVDVGRQVPYEGFQFRGTAHLSVGQEVSSMGAMSVLSKKSL